MIIILYDDEKGGKNLLTPASSATFPTALHAPCHTALKSSLKTSLECAFKTTLHTPCKVFAHSLRSRGGGGGSLSGGSRGGSSSYLNNLPACGLGALSNLTTMCFGHLYIYETKKNINFLDIIYFNYNK